MPLLGDAVGTVRFELVSGSRSRSGASASTTATSPSRATSGAADCVVRADKALFDGIASGEVNAMAALLRGALTFEGDPELLVRLQRVFPSPPAAASPRAEETAR